MLEDEFEIASLIVKYQTAALTEEEEECLMRWIDSSDERRKLFVRLNKAGNFHCLMKMAEAYDTRRAWEKVSPQLFAPRKISWRRWLSYAALFIFPITICYILLRVSVQTKPLEKEVLATSRILSGRAQAVLTLDDGTQIDLTKEKRFELTEKEGTKILKDSSLLNYSAVKSISSAEVKYNRISIPQGGEYTLVLSDGSRVFLNAMSTLRYPVNFTGKERCVELSGEAYFEVVKSEKPFIVKTADVAVEVLGTSFNVCSYADQAVVATTLVSGSVCVLAGGNKTRILPSQQANFDKKSKQIAVQTVDTSVYTAWKNGIFCFKDGRLEDMMTYLARWYDMRVVYKDEEVKKLKFGCSLNRYGEITPILNLLKETGKVNVEINENTIVFSKK